MYLFLFNISLHKSQFPNLKILYINTEEKLGDIMGLLNFQKLNNSNNYCFGNCNYVYQNPWATMWQNNYLNNPIFTSSLFSIDFSKPSNKPSNASNSNFRPLNYNAYGANGDKISKLAPKMQEKTMMLLDYAKSQGMKVSITSGFRTRAQQEHLLRTRPQYAAKNSLHCQGRAIDINIASGKDADYKKLANYAKSIGMRWGGDFRKVSERWHFDIGRA